MRLLMLLTAALLALSACSNDPVHVGSGGAPSGTGGTGGAGATGGTGGTGGALPACNQAGLKNGMLPLGGYQPFACNLPSVCDSVVFFEGPSTGLDAAHFTAPAAATCVLQALRDRTISRFSTTDNQSSIGNFAFRETVFIVDAAHAVSNWENDQDLDVSTGTDNRQILKPAAYFDGCLQLTDPNEIWKCLSAWSDGCADTAVSCPAH
jgi:hypothetical protein